MMSFLDPFWPDLIERLSLKGDGSWAFRGVCDSLFELQPKVGRPEVCAPGGFRLGDEQTLFDNFKREAQRYDRGLNFTALDWMAVAQHHGLPTRLLDWTTNPLVAVWFAVADETAKNDGLIHMVRFTSSDVQVSPDPFSSFPGPVLTRVPALAARITAQMGLFSIHPDPTQVWRPAAPLGYEQIAIPAASKPAVRSLLHFFGFNSARLMNDLDGLCRTLQWEYRNRWLATY